MNQGLGGPVNITQMSSGKLVLVTLLSLLATLAFLGKVLYYQARCSVVEDGPHGIISVTARRTAQYETKYCEKLLLIDS